MDNADYCRLQAEECRRLMALPQSPARSGVLKNLCQSWIRLANQIDLYTDLVKRERRLERLCSKSGSMLPSDRSLDRCDRV